MDNSLYNFTNKDLPTQYGCMEGPLYQTVDGEVLIYTRDLASSFLRNIHIPGFSTDSEGSICCVLGSYMICIKCSDIFEFPLIVCSIAFEKSKGYTQVVKCHTAFSSEEATSLAIKYLGLYL